MAAPSGGGGRSDWMRRRTDHGIPARGVGSCRRGDLNSDNVSALHPVRSCYLLLLPHYFRPVQVIPWVAVESQGRKRGSNGRLR